jgi:ATP/maltotriose-dependent transcriptional regulator MalT/DNA-binding SARP family transcriptional activator
MIAAMQASAVDPIDTRQFGFLSYPPPVGERLGMEEAWVSVETDVGDRLVDNAAQVRASFPLRPGKIQRPLLPNDTLRRDRLLDWLTARADKRLLYVAAEAGFGKTTLVADFLRRSRIRTFWYRLDDDDTDGLVFLRYLIASCQSVDPRLLARSANLLSQPSLEPARPEDVLETVLAEIHCLAEVPSALVLDDYHTVEHVQPIAAVLERLIARAPARLGVIVISRRTPGLAIAAIRARGELAEIGRDDLRFDESETDQLFRVSYNHPLEPDVLHDLQLRTEGWAASLQLVKAAVEHRAPVQVRAFVRTLTGAEGDLYDFLAEEVVGELPADLRNFLMRVALLEEADPETAAVAANVPWGDARRLLGQGQHLGLISMGVGAVSTWRLHPLVREFLLARLESEVGRAGIIQLHRGLAAALEPQSWRLAARHWAAADDAAEVRRVLCSAVSTIIGTGDLAAASDFMTRYPDPDPNPWYDILRTRLLASEGRYEEAEAAADRVDQTGARLGLATPALVVARALNRLHLGIQRQNPAMRAEASSSLALSGDLELAAIARAADLLWESSHHGSLDDLCAALSHAARLSHERSHPRLEGISLVNLAIAQDYRGDYKAAVVAGEAALSLLAVAGNSGDVTAAHVNLAKALAMAGDWRGARSHIGEALDTVEFIEPDTIAEAIELESMYGDPTKAQHALAQALQANPAWAESPYWQLTRARVELQRQNPESASELVASAKHHQVCPGFSSAIRSLDLQIRASRGLTDESFQETLLGNIGFATSQQAWFWFKAMQVTQALAATSVNLAEFVRSLDVPDATFLTMQAELVARRLGDLDAAGLNVVADEASRHPERWRWALRQLIQGPHARPSDTKRACGILEVVGEADDIKLLRQLAKKKTLRIPDAGKALARRLASPAYVDDLGRVSVRVNGRVVPGTEIRKKVLSLLAYLLTRPQFTASREQVIEALWPQMLPEAGANSLNQTSYFLRQIFEPSADDDITAGYLNSRADLIWLDSELVQSRSSDCLQLLAKIRRDSSPELVSRLADLYVGRFGVDFMYDDWACGFRDNLHAGVLDRLERAIIADTAAGAFDRALAVAQMALQVDPDADQIELCLLRLYRRMGANAAAAEQYSHYAAVLREQLGVEPPPLDAI